MATISRSRASLRIFGDELVPDEITSVLGHSPTKKQIKGEKIPSRNTSKFRTASTGGWWLKSDESEPGNLDAQIEDILGKLTDDLAVWEAIRTNYDVDLFCGLFMKETMEGVDISAKNMLALGSRGILIGLDIYAPCEEEEA